MVKVGRVCRRSQVQVSMGTKIYIYIYIYIYICICYISHMSLQKSAVKKIGNMVTIIQHSNNADSTL